MVMPGSVAIVYTISSSSSYKLVNMLLDREVPPRDPMAICLPHSLKRKPLHPRGCGISNDLPTSHSLKRKPLHSRGCGISNCGWKQDRDLLAKDPWDAANTPLFNLLRQLDTC